MVSWWHGLGGSETAAPAGVTVVGASAGPARTTTCTKAKRPRAPRRHATAWAVQGLVGQRVGSGWAEGGQKIVEGVGARTRLARSRPLRLRQRLEVGGRRLGSRCAPGNFNRWQGTQIVAHF